MEGLELYNSIRHRRTGHSVTTLRVRLRSLHLGHATGYSLIDFAARYHRQRGYNVMFPLCFDVNGTPVEVRVEKKYGINKYSVPRQSTSRMCEEYANSFIESMTQQFEILGESNGPLHLLSD